MTTKAEFLRIIKGSKSVKFKYIGNRNDVFNPCGTLQRQAAYEFYVITENGWWLLVQKNHRRSHDIVMEELENKYTKWSKLK